jgi:hypothetical protein
MLLSLRHVSEWFPVKMIPTNILTLVLRWPIIYWVNLEANRPRNLLVRTGRRPARSVMPEKLDLLSSPLSAFVLHFCTV